HRGSGWLDGDDDAGPLPLENHVRALAGGFGLDRELLDGLVDGFARDGRAADFLRLDLGRVLALVAPLRGRPVDDDLPAFAAGDRVDRVGTRLDVETGDRRGDGEVDDRRLVRAGAPQLIIGHEAAEDLTALHVRSAVADLRGR